MGIAAKLDDYGKPAWITVMILGFAFYWPLGLAMLAFLIGSGRMGCWKHGHAERWEQRFKDRFQEMGERWRGGRQYPSSGNRAFDEYRSETLKRLEEEQHEFRDFLDRLRHAKDKAEFDQFMAERGRRRDAPPPAA